MADIGRIMPGRRSDHRAADPQDAADALTGEIATAAGDLARAAEDLDALVRRSRLS